ncbi:hypothetical protein [Sphingomonas dokdonensis]|uniref:O-antigen ligase n=1 Tax=Sphingomonas dokdonensis TaxID=344880 RepID=A0A245ZKY1_9SPHN|nr:hypothetical protein [Sphingomonas dokdonensis]OWK30406.1 hypothetical protein SPDO_20920 [Sphingomonas dokdonensis]
MTRHSHNIPKRRTLATFGQGQRRETLFWAISSGVAVFLAMLMLSLFGAISYVIIVPALIGLTFAKPQFALIVIFCAIYFQSIMISFLMQLGSDEGAIQASQAFSFIALTIMALCALAVLVTRKKNKIPVLGRRSNLILPSFLCLGVVALYAALGLTSASVASVASYVRLYCLLPFGIFIALAFARRFNTAFLCDVCIYFTLVALALGALEIAFPREFYTYSNMVPYVVTKYSDDVQLRDVDDLMRIATRSFLNLSSQFALDLKFVRPYGPTIHSITFAYVVTFGAAIAIVRRQWLALALCFPMLIFIGSKGVLVLVLCLLMIDFVSRGVSRRMVPWVFAILMIAYVVITLAYGAATADYHYLGLRGGIVGFFERPWGHGVGVGGNLSDLGRSDARDFQEFARSGASDFALESGFAVALYQMGVLGLIFFFLWYRVGRMLLQRSHDRSLNLADRRTCLIVGHGLLILIVTSIFQEETLSPASLGMWSILAVSILITTRQETSIASAGRIDAEPVPASLSKR